MVKKAFLQDRVTGFIFHVQDIVDHIINLEPALAARLDVVVMEEVSRVPAASYVGHEPSESSPPDVPSVARNGLHSEPVSDGPEPFPLDAKHPAG